MNNLQEKQLSIYSAFESLCRKHDIPVFLAFGSAIGAVRHQGFIPWDDDLDVFIFAEDRDRVFEICSRELPSDFFYQSPQSDKEYRLAIDRVRLSSTTLIELNEVDRDINHGVFIDVYPLYGCSDSKIGYCVQYLSAYLYRSVLYGYANRNAGLLKRGIQGLVATLTPQFIKKIVLEKSFNFIKSLRGPRFLSTFYGDEVNLRYPSEWFSGSKEVVFENRAASVSCEVEACLTMEYGSFMDYPSSERQVPHHDYEFLDLENSYKIHEGLKFLRDRS